MSKWLVCLIVLAGCSTTPPTVVTETKTVTLNKLVLVPVPAALTQTVEIPQLPASADTLELGATYRATVIRLMVANMQLAEIRKLK